MRITIRASTFFWSSIVSIFIFFITTNSYAGYLIPVEPCCQSYEVIKVYKVKYVKHFPVKHTKHFYPKKYKRHHHHFVRGCCACRTCVHRYIRQHEFVEFIAAPAPPGHYVNLDDCDNYAPDRTTGDDDPMVYPGMDIDE